MYQFSYVVTELITFPVCFNRAIFLILERHVEEALKHIWHVHDLYVEKENLRGSRRLPMEIT